MMPVVGMMVGVDPSGGWLRQRGRLRVGELVLFDLGGCCLSPSASWMFLLLLALVVISWRRSFLLLFFNQEI